MESIKQGGTSARPALQEQARSDLPCKPTVVLIGNYVHDGQQSMQRFSAVLEKELSALGVEIVPIRPEPFFGRLRPGASGIGKWLGYLDKFLVFPRRLRARLRSLKVRKDRVFVVHVCDHSNAFYTRHLQNVPHVVTCHDMLAIRSALGEIPENPTRWSGRRLQKMILGGLCNSQKIACVSINTRLDLCRLVPGAENHSLVVMNGLNNDFSPRPVAMAMATVHELAKASGHPLPEGARYIIHVGGEQWYKNRPGVVDLFCELRGRTGPSEIWLVMVGKPFNSGLRLQIEKAGLGGRVLEMPGVSHEDLCALYSAAELLLFPSLQEGFGWPIIEAQACGCPVVTTARPPMNEVGGDAAAYIDPDNMGTSLDALLKVLHESAGERQERIRLGLANAAKYSTARMIDDYLKLYVETAKDAAGSNRALQS